MIKQDTIEGIVKPTAFQFISELATEKRGCKREVNTLKFIRFFCDDKKFLKDGFVLRVQNSENVFYKDYIVQKPYSQYQDTVIDFALEKPIDIRLYKVFISSFGLQSELNFKFFLDNSKV